MPNPQNTGQVLARRAGQGYLETYELESEAISPATKVGGSFGRRRDQRDYRWHTRPSNTGGDHAPPRPQRLLRLKA